MTMAAHRRARLLRLRVIDHRVAVVRAAHAQAAFVDATDIADRLARLGGAIVATAGVHHGGALHSRAELNQRLDRAQVVFAQTLADRRAVRDRRQAECRAALHARDRIADAHAAATVHDEAQRDQRVAATLPPRQRAKRGLSS
jgi:hypothetical protein